MERPLALEVFTITRVTEEIVCNAKKSLDDTLIVKVAATAELNVKAFLRARNSWRTSLAR